MDFVHMVSLVLHMIRSAPDMKVLCNSAGEQFSVVFDK